MTAQPVSAAVRIGRRHWIERALLAPPSWTALDEPLRDRFRRIDAAVDAAAALSARLPHAGLDGALPPPLAAWRDIHHRLTARFEPITTPIDLESARRERAVLRTSGGWRRGEALAALCDHARALAGQTELRARAIATSADQLGRHIVFPSAEHIPAQVARLETFLDDHARAPRAFRAIVAQLLITNCHPFHDGNGRVSRVVFNHLLDGGRAARFYLPLREIAAFSRGGYIVRARQAEIRGDWQPLADFMLAAVAFWQRQLVPKLAALRPPTIRFVNTPLTQAPEVLA